ncbi:MAG TPA: alpha/beta fold hydrolase [Candidatus Thermoplasmatota archaeon]|nr:alpha/beta fold hydrolase [Candidatus Thermoplasmatota archaeon]
MVAVKPVTASRWARVGDYDVHYLTAEHPGATSVSAEPPVVFLHGFGAWSEVVWSRTLAALAETHRTLAPDMVGFGLSTKPRIDHFRPEDPLEGPVKDLRAFLDATRVPRATLVGHSFGGGVALRFALDNPDRVHKLVLVDSMGLGRSIHYVYKALAFPVLGTQLSRPHRGRIERMWRMIVQDPALITPEIIERNYELLSAPGAADVFATARLGVDAVGQRLVMRDRLGEVKLPTLVVWGRDDRIFPVRHGKRAVKLLPKARLEILDDCGHVPPFERPDAFNATLLRFLRNGTAPA